MSSSVRSRTIQSVCVSRQFELFVTPAPEGGLPASEDEASIARHNDLNAITIPAPARGDKVVVTNHPAANRTPSAHAVANLLDVLTVLEGVVSPAPQDAEVRSAVRMTGKVLGRRLEDIPAYPPELARLLAAASPALVSMSTMRWVRVRSLLRTALQRAGVKVLPGRRIAELTPAWSALHDQLPTDKLKIGLSGLISFFNRDGYLPNALDHAAFDAYREALATTSLDAGPDGTFNAAVRRWSEAMVAVPDWPQVNIQARPDPRHFSLPWEAFEVTFRADVEAFLDYGGNQDPFAATGDYAPSVKQSTVAARKGAIRILASAAIASGIPASDLATLTDLVGVNTAKAALKHLMGRHGGKTSPQIGNLSQLLCTIARYWVKVPADHDVALRKLAAALRVPAKGMRPKNRKRLAQFDLPTNLEALLDLPDRVLKQVKAQDSGAKSDAVRVMMALAIKLLTMSALRIDNLTGLEVERHLVIVRRAGKSFRRIAIPEEETKTGVAIEMPLSPDSVALLEAYLRNYRTRVCDADSLYLFPGRGGARRSTESFSSLIKKYLWKEAGLTMHPHLFRHLAAKLHLDINPADIETVRQILQHTSTRTTLRAYADLKTGPAYRRFDDTITAHRKAAAKPLPQSQKAGARRL